MPASVKGIYSSMNQAVSEIPVAATTTDGGSLSGAVEKTDDRVVTDDVGGTENVPVVFRAHILLCNVLLCKWVGQFFSD